ncbi:MAG: hypothetical protein ABIP94_16280 [Planctomycetota bacterium]
MTIHRQHAKPAAFSPTDIAARIRHLRGQRVLLDEDLARLYAVPTKAAAGSNVGLHGAGRRDAV